MTNMQLTKTTLRRGGGIKELQPPPGVRLKNKRRARPVYGNKTTYLSTLRALAFKRRHTLTVVLDDTQTKLPADSQSWHWQQTLYTQHEHGDMMIFYPSAAETGAADSEGISLSPSPRFFICFSPLSLAPTSLLFCRLALFAFVVVVLRHRRRESLRGRGYYGTATVRAFVRTSISPTSCFKFWQSH